MEHGTSIVTYEAQNYTFVWYYFWVAFFLPVLEFPTFPRWLAHKACVLGTGVLVLTFLWGFRLIVFKSILLLLSQPFFFFFFFFSRDQDFLVVNVRCSSMHV